MRERIETALDAVWAKAHGDEVWRRKQEYVDALTPFITEYELLRGQRDALVKALEETREKFYRCLLHTKSVPDEEFARAACSRADAALKLAKELDPQ